jgi:hypothetical protein
MLAADFSTKNQEQDNAGCCKGIRIEVDGGSCGLILNDGHHLIE